MSADVQTHLRHKGDTLLPLAVQFTRPDGSLVDLTGLAVKFKLLSSQGEVKIPETETGVTVTDALAGKAQYKFQPAGADTPGLFPAYFVAYSGAESDHFPVARRALLVRIDDD